MEAGEGITKPDGEHAVMISITEEEPQYVRNLMKFFYEDEGEGELAPATTVPTKIERLLKQIQYMKDFFLSVYYDRVSYEDTYEADEEYMEAIDNLCGEYKRYVGTMELNGVITETMSRDLWFAHVLHFGPLVLNLLKKLIITDFQTFKNDLLNTRKMDNEADAKEHFNRLMSCVVKESACNFYIAYWTAYGGLLSLDFNSVSSVTSYLGLMLLFEWIITGLNSSDSFKDMATMVKKKVEDGELLHALYECCGSVV